MADPIENSELFAPSPFLEWLPDETLFSLVSRIHKLSGHQLASRTAKTLFGSPHAGTHHDLPNSLGPFEKITHQTYGSAEDLAINRTLLKYYRAFIPLSDSKEIAETMRGSSVAHLKFRLGLITSRFRANHPLKACPSCMADDYDRYGWTYWHLTHQFPGIWMCDKHNRPLCESFIKSTGVGRFLWHLPNLKMLRQQFSSNIDISHDTESTLSSLSKTIKILVINGQDKPWDTQYFWITYRKELSRRGWLASNRLRFSEMATDFLSYSKRLHILPEFSTMPTSSEQAAAQLGRLLRSPRSGTHPLRHCILIDWLFGGLTEFLLCRNETHRASIGITPVETHKNISDKSQQGPRRLYVLELLRAHIISMRVAAKIAGVDVSTVMAWSAQAGITISRRPKLLIKDKRDALIANLRLGTDKADAALQFSVSVETVSRLLRTEPGLQNAWHTARFNKAQQHARSSWNLLINTYPQLGTKLLRSLEPAIYAWLYRNDRDWIKEHSPRTVASAIASTNQPMWDKRDITLSTEVQRTALHLKQQNPRSPIHLWQLYQLIPDLKAKLEVLDRLPLTKRAIDTILAGSSKNLPSNSGLF